MTADMVDDPVPLLMEQVPGLSEEEARRAADSCVGEEILDEYDPDQMSFIEITYPLPSGAECMLWAVAWFTGSAAGGDFDVVREDPYTERAAAEEAWKREITR
ncbi:MULTISPECIES: hypothetical protein [unclassified Streptomyces]|uniref:hypothetical protein n=1 Tax=unclassified Streptomyces TaxID=2593676 RepID=UPI0004C9ACEE|nr:MULTISPECIES: hypothetical protein [unclassified Streptomyces]KOV73380.1 hypothetical protein ADL02_40105 [Streptomyces sp. NRRL WC-3723]